ncbi:uncharacterized protein LOC125513486 [Triticum urartu]|uniref:uncharacterized protein LOC125513486 n=1 Tax=Triticum urartu TaxID=4572 RepID=UPI0020437D8D|nr:uncharacterized protein LOC125513486 [Triticum urartu]
MDAEVFASGRSRGDNGVDWASALALLVKREHARRRKDKSIESRPGLEFAAIRRKCSWPESPSEKTSNPRILGLEKHHVAFEFAGGRSTEFTRGRRTFVEPTNIANGGYTRGIIDSSSTLANSAANELNMGA